MKLTTVVGVVGVAGVALVVGALGPAATTRAASARTAPLARSVVTLEGHYSGRDGHGHHIRFNFQHGHLAHFRVNHHDIGGADVSHARWSTSCADAFYCSWGEWTSDEEVRGAWNQGTHGHTARHFHAHWVSSHPS